MKNKERKELVEWAIDYARKNGADQASISLGQVRSIEISHRDHKLDEIKESTQSGISIQIYANNRYSSRSTSDLKKESLKNFITEGIKLTKFMSPDEFRSLPDPSLYPKDLNRIIDVNDPNFANLESSERVKFAQDIEKAAWDEGKNIISVTSSFNDVHSNRILANSNGFIGESEYTSYSCGAEVTVKDGETGRPEDWDYTVSRYLKDLDDIQELGRNAARYAMAKVGQKKIASGKYDIVVKNRAMSNLIRLLTSPMYASSIQQKNSYLEGKLDQQIASPVLTMTDNPFIPRGLGSRLFDSEGMAVRNRVLIEKGILKEFFVDNYYGKKLNWKPNNGSYGNLVFEQGSRSAEEMISSMDKGILVTGFIGGNMNGTTGDFSYGIIGQLIENGKIVHGINEMNITGNASDLWANLVEVGNDPITYSSQLNPSMMFRNADLSGT